MLAFRTNYSQFSHYYYYYYAVSLAPGTTTTIQYYVNYVLFIMHAGRSLGTDDVTF